VVNALSSSLIVRVKRDGKHHVQTYSKGLATSKLKTEGKTRGTGTTVTFIRTRRSSAEVEVRSRADPRSAGGEELPAPRHDRRAPRGDAESRARGNLPARRGIADTWPRCHAAGEEHGPRRAESAPSGRFGVDRHQRRGLPETELTAQGGEIPSVPPVAAMQIPPARSSTSRAKATSAWRSRWSGRKRRTSTCAAT